MPPAVIRVLPLDGVWETVGQGRLAGVTHEGLHYTHDQWGSATCSFTLRRDPRALQPDLAAWTPCEIEKHGVQAWVGRVRETPTREGADAAIDVAGTGMQYHLDDDMKERKYVHANLTDWVDRRSVPGVTLGTGAYTANANVQVGEGAITLAFAGGSVIGASDRASVVFDAGPENLIERAVWHFTTSNNNNGTPQAQVFCSGYNGLDGLGSGATVCGWNGSALTTVGPGPGYQSGTLSTRCRYLSFILFWTAGGTVTNDAWVSLDQITLFTSSAYESGNASILTPSAVVADVATAMLPLVSSDQSQIDSRGFGVVGPKSPSAAANRTGLGTIAWANPTNVFTSNDVRATAAVAVGNQLSNFLEATGFGFSIPSDATVLGIVVEVERSAVAGGTFCNDNSVQIVKGGVRQGNQKADITTQWPTGGDAFKTYGDPRDLWGVSWTPADINGSGFGFQIAVNGDRTAQVDFIRITVYWTESFLLDDFALEGEHTAREFWDAVDAYNAWVKKIDEQYRPVYQQLPSSPALAIGEWSGADFQDATANSGEEIYSDSIVEATGADGTPVRIRRNQSQQPVALTGFRPVSTPAPSNPSFAVDTSSWSVTGSGVTITRTTTAGQFDSSPAGGDFNVGLIGGATLTETFTGTFKKGVLYVLQVKISSKWNSTQVDYLNYWSGPTMEFGLLGTDQVKTVLSGIPQLGLGFATFTIGWKPSADRTGVTFLLTYHANEVNTAAFSAHLYVDSLSLGTLRPTLVDARGFNRATTLPVQAAVTPAGGQRMSDIWLSQHRTTPSKGSATAVFGGVRSMQDGHPVHPGLLGMYTTELVRLAHRVDPDSGGLGRDVRLVDVDYDDDGESAGLSFDNTRTNFEALLARYALFAATHRSR